MADWLVENIRGILPKLPEESLINIKEKLTELGVETVEDLQEIKEEDLEEILPVVKCRRLVRAWKAQAAEPVPKPEDQAAQAGAQSTETPVEKSQERDDYDVMISYCWKPEAVKKRAHELCARLRDNKLRVWIDNDEMRGDMVARMIEGVRNSKVIVACLSEGYQSSENCKKEYDYAEGEKKHILPVKVDSHKLGDRFKFLSGKIIYRDVSSEELMKENFPAVLQDIRWYLEGKVPEPELKPEPKPKPGGKNASDNDIGDIIDHLAPAELSSLYYALGLNQKQIETAENDAGTHKLEQKARSVLQKWRTLNFGKATREAVLSALENCQNRQAKEELKEIWGL